MVYIFLLLEIGLICVLFGPELARDDMDQD
jgi:hypothetical protein